MVVFFALALTASSVVALAAPGANAGRRRARASGVAKAIPHLEPTADRRWPDSFAGLWEESGGATSRPRTFELRPASLSLAAGERKTVPLAFDDPGAAAKLARLLKRKAYRRGSSAEVDIHVTDGAGNSTTRQLEVELGGGKSRRSATARHVAASAPTQIGETSPLSPSDCGGTYDIVQAQTGGAPSYEVPADGVITSWSHTGGAGDAGSGRLQLWRHTARASYELVGRSEVEDFHPGSNSFATSVAAKKGDLLGLRTDGEAGCLFGAAAADQIRTDGADTSDPGPGAIRDMAIAATELRANVSATLQRDEQPDQSLAFDAEAAGLRGTGELSLTLACPDEDCRVEITGGAVARRQKPGKRVFVAFTEKARQRVRRLRSDFPKPSMLRPVLFQRSLAELQAQQRRMIADRERFRTTGAPFPAVTSQLYDLDIDVQRNAPVVIMQHPTDATTAAFRHKYGSDVIVEADPPAELFDTATTTRGSNCSSRADCYPLRSGLKTTTNGRGFCSTAFTAYLGRSATLGVLSAAHCGGPNPSYPNSDLGSARYNGTTPRKYGIVYREQESGAVDAEWHLVTQEPFTTYKPKPLVYRTNKYTGFGINSDGKASELVVGQPGICKSGVTTGTTCGHVISKNYAPGTIPGSHDFVRATYCADHGDSGAGVYYDPGYRTTGLPSYKAIGIESGGAKDTPCDSPKFYSFFGQIQYVEQALGVNVTHWHP